MRPRRLPSSGVVSAGQAKISDLEQYRGYGGVVADQVLDRGRKVSPRVEQFSDHAVFAQRCCSLAVVGAHNVVSAMMRCRVRSPIRLMAGLLWT